LQIDLALMKRWSLLVLFLAGLQAADAAQPKKETPCGSALIHCFLPDYGSLAVAAGASPTVSRPRMVTMNIRASHGGVLAHQWVELTTSRGIVTIGYGPASIPFIDAGQISVWNQDGHIERNGLHLLPTHFNYAKPPGAGQVIGQPVALTLAQSDAVLRKENHRKLIFPYIPIFHDCHTFVCTVKATADGKSGRPCYLLFKGYW
jgi:hypothetical protein